MTVCDFRSEMDVELIDTMGSDFSVVRAARVSTGKDASYVPDPGWPEDAVFAHKDVWEAEQAIEAAGLINFLLANRHGTPFEHNAFTFRISAPIFVWREFMRHRIGFSYNEESGRYKQLEPVFYVPAPDRNLVQVGKAGKYSFVPGDADQQQLVLDCLASSCEIAYQDYQEMLDAGIAREVARMLLPVNIYSSAYVTCNARSLMAFLSLRTKREDSKFPSYPQREIEMVAEQMEEHFKECMPITWNAFNSNGRVAP